MTITYVSFMKPITAEWCPGGAEYWSPQKYDKVTAKKDGGGIVFAYEHAGQQRTVNVPMTNIAHWNAAVDK